MGYYEFGECLRKKGKGGGNCWAVTQPMRSISNSIGRHMRVGAEA